MSGDGGYVQIQFALDDPIQADAIVATLLARHLVACGQRTAPVISHYRWKGVLEQAEECLVLLKTRAELAEQVIDVIVGDHPYETPEVIVLPVVQASVPYLDWITEVTVDAAG